MSMFYARNLQNYSSKRKFHGHNFIIPPEKYIEIYKKVYEKFKSSNGVLSLYELKRFAIDEAKKASSSLNLNTHKISDEGTKILQREDLIKLLKALYDVMDPYLIKINHNFKNEILNLFLNTLYHNKLPYMIKFTFSHSHFIETSFIY